MMQTFQNVPSESEINSYHAIALIASNNPHWKKLGGGGRPEEVVPTILSVMLLARELGFSPMQAISGGIHNIQGKFEISARLMNQAIRSRGHKMKVVTLTDEVCKLWGQRKDTGEEMEVTYCIEEAKRSGLVKEGGPWKKIPQDMLFARAISRLARRLYPDCIGSAYIEGELQEAIQGKSPETIELPPKEQFVEAKVEVVLHLPSDVDANEIEEYLAEIKSRSSLSLEQIKQKASEKMESFLSKFYIWREGRISVE